MLRTDDALIQSAEALLRTTSDTLRRTLTQEAIEPLDRRLEAVQRLVSRLANGVIDVVVLGKPGVGTSTLVSTLAAALQSPMSTDVPEDLAGVTPTNTAAAEVCGNRILLTAVSDTSLDDLPVDERLLAAFAAIVVIDSEPYSHDVARLEQLQAAVPGVPVFVFVNKLDVLQYMHGADLPHVEARIRDKVAPFVVDADTDVVFGCAAISDGRASPTAAISRLLSAALPLHQADSVLNIRLTNRVRASVAAVREEAAMVHVTQHAILAAHHPLRHAALLKLVASVAAIMGVDTRSESMSSMIGAVHRQFNAREGDSSLWVRFVDRILCVAPLTTSGIRRRRYSRLIRFGETVVEAARMHTASAPSAD